ncbi:uncharacterized protein zgc:152951 isoform X1 [Platichthys flesus]|uniref:uncharacterized protein zgc:152951 isoform X1 n=1 Tax=Platichthys flesus TaxID=8260 RepID=UPI002DB7CF20|nr:uncharacterized protein zgc:152951 isoform X1 [Platichthys flesus]
MKELCRGQALCIIKRRCYFDTSIGEASDTAKNTRWGIVEYINLWTDQIPRLKYTLKENICRAAVSKRLTQIRSTSKKTDTYFLVFLMIDCFSSHNLSFLHVGFEHVCFLLVCTCAASYIPALKEFMCEKDELADLVQDLKHGSVIGSQRRGLSVYKKSFSGDQLVDWLQKEKGMARAEACSTGQALLQKKYIVSVRGCGQQDGGFGEGENVTDALYRLLEDDPHSALNAGQTAGCSVKPAAELSLLLRELILKLFSEHLSADGKSVDYKGMSSNPAFKRYSELAIQLQRVELLSLSREEKLAFFINTYNALVIHGFLRLGAPTNMWSRYRFFNYVSYLIGGEVFTLQDIENGVLRGNKKGLAQFRRPFSNTDPRLQLALPSAEPLIHFALNCGAKGCPPIKTYTPQDIDSQLRISAEAFLENDDGCVVDSGKREVRLSQIFKWYKADFGGTDENLLKWVLEHMGASPKKTSLQGVMSEGKTKVTFLPYDWSSNGSH